MKKEYTVWYITKMNCHGYVNKSVVTASNQKEAFELAEADSQAKYNRHAFSKTTIEPEWTNHGLFYKTPAGGGTYTKARLLDHDRVIVW